MYVVFFKKKIFKFFGLNVWCLPCLCSWKVVYICVLNVLSFIFIIGSISSSNDRHRIVLFSSACWLNTTFSICRFFVSFFSFSLYLLSLISLLGCFVCVCAWNNLRFNYSVCWSIAIEILMSTCVDGCICVDLNAQAHTYIHSGLGYGSLSVDESSFFYH